jgi:hypothetical protein
LSLSFEDFADDETTVVVGGGGAYQNGYSYRRTLRVGGTAVGGSAALTNLPLRVDETMSSFKSAANGGKVQSASGWDIRFETASGTQLDHELEVYSPAAGRIACWVRIPTATPAVDQDIFLYYGKPGLAVSEENPPGVWVRCLGCWRMPDGHDMTGHGRDMTTSGVTSGAIGGHPAAVLAASSYLELLDTTFLDSKSEFTPFLLVQPSSLPTGTADFVRFGGTTAGTGRLAYTYYTGADIASALRNYVWIGAGTAFLVGPANSAVASHIYTWACAAKSAAWPIQEFDGAPVVSTRTGVFGTGVTSYPSTVLLRIGAGYGDNTTCVPGKYGRFWVFDSRVPDAFITFLDLTIRYPRACYGISDEDASGATDRSPVMAPVVASVGAGGSVNIDVLSRAGDPDGQGLTAGTATPAATLGTVSVVANLIRYVAGSVQGLDLIGVTAASGGKTARTLLSVTVGAGGGSSGDGSPLPVAPLASRTATWEAVKSSGASASFVQGTADVELQGAAVGVANGAAGLVTIKGGATGNGMFNPPFVVEFDYQPTSLSETPPSGGIFSQLGLYRRSDGGAGGANLASFGGPDGAGVWTADYSPTDVFYSTTVSGHAHARGIRLSFDTNSSGSGSNQIRGRSIADDGTISAANFGYGGGGQKTFDFRTPGGVTHLAWSFPGGQDATVTATFSDRSVTTQTFSDALIAQWLGGEARNILLMVSEGRRGKFSNVTVTQGAVSNAQTLARWFAAAPVAGAGTRHSVVGPATFPTGTVGPGAQWVVENDIDLGGTTKTITFGGSATHAAYFRGDRESQGPTGLRTISNGVIQITGSKGILRGLCFKNCMVTILASDTLQIESNWFCDIAADSGDHSINANGRTDAINILVAFNLWKRKTSESSAGIFTLTSYGDAGTTPTAGRARFYNSMFYRNEVQRDAVGSGADHSNALIGRGPQDEFRDLRMTIMENLYFDHSISNLMELKYPGCWFVRNTIEMAAAVGGGTGQIRIRHSRLPEDPATDIDAGGGDLIEGNLWVNAGSGAGGPEITVRDGFHTIINNWGVTLASGVQPTVNTQSNGRLRVGLYSAHLDWQGYPASDIRNGGQNWMNAGKCKVGGNRATVEMGLIFSGEAATYKPDRCRIGQPGTGRPDQNAAFKVTTGETNTDKTGTVIGADYNLVPVRRRSVANGFAATDVDVGFDGYDPSVYGIKDS